MNTATKTETSRTDRSNVPGRVDDAAQVRKSARNAVIQAQELREQGEPRSRPTRPSIARR
jgi:hypothetical protein